MELKEAGVPDWILYDRINLEVRIRSGLEAQGIELNYEQIVDERKPEYPKPRDLDKKLKEMIAPSLCRHTSRQTQWGLNC